MCLRIIKDILFVVDYLKLADDWLYDSYDFGNWFGLWSNFLVKEFNSKLNLTVQYIISQQFEQKYDINKINRINTVNAIALFEISFW